MNEEKLSKSINRLSDILVMKSKIWNVFLTGVITGVGTAIGAALIGSILVGLIASNLGRIPILKEVVSENSIEGVIENGN